MIEIRIKTGDICRFPGNYQFRSYTDGTVSPPPTSEERVLPLDRGDHVPPVRSSGKGAWYSKLA
ncbi:MAG: YjzC family protein [Myxococcota bacterium]